MHVGERIAADDENPIKKKKEKLVKECTTALDTLPKPSEEELNPYLIFPSPEENYKVTKKTSRVISSIYCRSHAGFRYF
ncbi:hypothetical protein CsSME_00030771 [Camellia sinensis var. sinensis]